MPKIVKQTKTVARKKTTGTFADRIQTLGEALQGGLKVNLYGRSGTGKTTLWATFPKPILALVCSGSTQPGELRSINTPEYRKGIKPVTINCSGDIGEAVAYLKDEGSEFATVVLDHASGLQDLVLREILGLAEAPVQLSWGLATQQQYGQVALQMKERLRSLLDLPQHVVIVAQERDFSPNDENSLLIPCVGSALTPSVTGWLNPACDYICQTYIRRAYTEQEVTVGNKKVKTKKPSDRMEYCLRTAPHEIYTTKFRLPKGKELPLDIVDPDFDKIMELIEG